MFSVPSSPAKIILDLIRHGEPEGGVKYRGSIDDPLSDVGWLQMRSASQAAIDAGCVWNSILTSPLQRCNQFAKELATELTLPCQSLPSLREICFGDLEGLTPSEAWLHHGRLLKNLWSNPEKYTPPNGEPYPDFRARVQEGLSHIIKHYRDQHLLLVIHGGTIRVLLHLLLHFRPRDTFSIEIPYGGMTRITVFIDGGENNELVQTASLGFINRFTGDT